MDLFEFIHYCLNPLLEKLANEKKAVIFLRDVNVDLLKYDQHKATNEFLDSLSSNMFLPYLILSDQLELLFTLIDNFFSNCNHFRSFIPQFLIVPHIFSNIPNRKTNVFECDWSKFNH